MSCNGSHTPGRWFAEPPEPKDGGKLNHRNFHWTVRYECPDGRFISAEIAMVTSMNTGHEEANARHMASAPDLLYALQDLDAIVRDLCALYGHPLPKASLDGSKAAIAKALGQA